MTQGNNRTRTMPITRVEVTKGKRTLRVWLAPSGDDKTEYQFWLQEAIKLWPWLLRAPLNRESTRTGIINHDYSKIWISTWCYVFHWEGMQ
jgi:hypothetical protein